MSALMRVAAPIASGVEMTLLKCSTVFLFSQSISEDLLYLVRTRLLTEHTYEI